MAVSTDVITAAASAPLAPSAVAPTVTIAPTLTVIWF
jgi:hypothetical protein